jgi:hypothetical protein
MNSGNSLERAVVWVVVWAAVVAAAAAAALVLFVTRQ